MAAFEAWLVFLILVVNVVGELQRKRTLAASRGFLAAARLSCSGIMLRNWPFPDCALGPARFLFLIQVQNSRRHSQIFYWHHE